VARYLKFAVSEQGNYAPSKNHKYLSQEKHPFFEIAQFMTADGLSFDANFRSSTQHKMGNSKSNKTGLKWLLGVVIFLGIAIIAWQFLKSDLKKADSKVKKKLTEEFKEMVTEASDSLYTLSYTRFDINIDSGMMHISDFKLTPDSAILAKLIQEKRAPNNVLTMSAKDMVVSHFGFEKTEQGRRFNVKRVLLRSPNVTIVNHLRPYNDTANSKKPKKLFKLMEKLMKVSNIESMSMRNADLVYINENHSSKRSNLRNLNIDISGFSATSTKLHEKEYTAIAVKKYRLATPDSLYYLTMNDAKYVPERKEIRIAKAELAPRLDKKAFFTAVKWAKDRIHLVQENMVMKNIDTEKLLSKQQLHVGRLSVANSWAEVYTNYNWPRRTPPVRKNPFPNQMLQQIAFDLKIDTMRLNNADTYYRVLAEKSDKVSSLIIRRSRGNILNITNNKEAIDKNAFMTADLSSELMGAAPMHLHMRFNLADKNGAHSYTSTLAKMDATLLNNFSEPFAMMSVKSGTIERMVTNVSADEFSAKGNVDLYYKDMTFALLKKDKETKELKSRPIISFLSNTMLPNNNPSKNGKFKKGPINVSRESNMSFFGFMAKCMIDGMSSSMTGLAQKKKEEDSSIITKLGKVIVGDKKN
jgi:hypothetical protein